MGRVLPILFNGDMVQAILDGRKTVTRRIVKYKYSNTEMRMRTDKYGTSLIEIQKDIEGETHGKYPDGRTWSKLRPYIQKNPPYRKGDILYVRETYCPDYFDYENQYGNKHGYKTDYEKAILSSDIPKPKWTPAIHMPKQAARIWLKVTDVRVEQLQEIDGRGVLAEGIDNGKSNPSMGKRWENMQRMAFSELWDSTIKKSDLERYGWCANPWVWAIEFERREKSESEGR